MVILANNVLEIILAVLVRILKVIGEITRSEFLF